jgi:hypothetical protein
MHTGRLVASVIGLSLLCGCAMFQPKHLLAPCGANDYIACPIGTKIQGVPLPTDENKTYTVVTPKVGFWISMECDERIGR